MPIRKDLKPFYRGAAWKRTRLRILTRAAHRCEQCGVKDHFLYERGPQGSYRCAESRAGEPWKNSSGNITTFEPAPAYRRTMMIVLTIAHLNHIPGDDRDENLKALCQWCHLNYDRLHHKDTRTARKDAARPMLSCGEEGMR
jgi:5-methylcytosine-specific restriction endonuclease McrA